MNSNAPVPYDPDFDDSSSPKPSSRSASSGLLNSLPPKTAFIGGVITSLGFIFTIGFFALLAVML